MISVGGGVALLCLAIVGVILSERPWIKVLSTLYLAFYAVVVIIEVIRGHWNPMFLIVPVLLVLFGMYVHGVHRMFGSKN